MSIAELRKEVQESISLVDDPARLCDIFILIVPPKKIESSGYSTSIMTMLEQRRREHSVNDPELLSWQDLRTRLEVQQGIKG